MSDPLAAEFSAYGQNVSRAANDSRKALPINAQLELPDILDLICANPKELPRAQVKAVDRAGRILLYEHLDPRIQVTFEIEEESKTLYFMHFVAPTLAVQMKVFVSYAHEDAGTLDEIRERLQSLEVAGLIKLWDDTQIRAGDEWLAAIDREMAAARLALLLVSESFALSEFIRDHELKVILRSVEAKAVTLLWVAVSKAPFAELGVDRYQALNDPQSPLENFEGSARKAQLDRIYAKIEQVVRG